MIKFLLISLLFPVFCSAQSIDNLDIKNGFLQFRLGDSISTYKSIALPNKKHPKMLEINLKFIKLNRYIDGVFLNFENGILTYIDVFIKSEYKEDYMDAALKNAYGPGLVVDKDTTDEHGLHINYETWIGKRVSATIKRYSFNASKDVRASSNTFETLTFKKTSDTKVQGDLPPGFIL